MSGKLIFAASFELKLFRVTVANANIGSLNSLPTLFNVFGPHAGEL